MPGSRSLGSARAFRRGELAETRGPTRFKPARRAKRPSDPNASFSDESHPVVSFRGRTALPSLAARHLIDADGRREDEGFVLTGCDLDSVGVPDPKPTLRDLGDLIALALDLVLVVDDIPLRLHVLAALNLDREAVA